MAQGFLGGFEPAGLQEARSWVGDSRGGSWGNRSGTLGGLFDITSVCRGRARLCLVVLGCLTRGYPAVPRAPPSIGAPPNRGDRGSGKAVPGGTILSWGRDRDRGRGGGGVSPSQPGGHRTPAAGVPVPVPAGPGRAAALRSRPPPGGSPLPPDA